MAAAVQNVAPASGESKSARKKRAKAEGGSVSNGSAPVPAVPAAPVTEDSSLNAKGDEESHAEHPYVKELSKQIRNIHKKLAGMQKTDAIIAENPGSSLDQLVAARKINADQKSSVEKKPQLQSQLTTLEDQVLHYRKFDSEFQTQLQKQRDDMTAQHQKELEKARESVQLEGVTVSEAELRSKLLIFSQFLRCAAARRGEEDQNTDEHRAFEGALLQVYGGNQDAVQAAVKLIDGSDEQVPSIEGELLPIKYSQVRQASIEHTPFQTEEDWVDSVAEANALAAEVPAVEREAYPIASDPTIAHAGLTELETPANTNGVPEQGAEDALTSPPQGDAGDSAGNAAGDQWDTSAPGADKSLMEDSLTILPRPSDEVDTPVSVAPEGPTSWADDAPPSYDAVAPGNTAGEAWVADQAEEKSHLAEVAAQAGAGVMVDEEGDASAGAGLEDADGFHQVPGRHRGRGRGRGGDSEFRGRGRGRGGFRGDGEFRGRGRGGFRGRGEGGEYRGEYRGRGGRGRGFRGNGEGPSRGA